jgi:hypothetical protein
MEPVAVAVPVATAEGDTTEAELMVAVVRALPLADAAGA